VLGGDGAVAAGDAVTVGEELGASLLRPLHRRGVQRQNVGPVEVGDEAAEALGLHLGGIVALGHVKALESLREEGDRPG